MQLAVTGNVGGSVASVTAAVALPSSANINITGNITGNLSGTVGNVTGAVGSVTGNVGGSVASVTASVTLGTNEDTALTRLYAMTNATPAFTAPALANGPGGSGADPWLTVLPGAYTAGEAGYIVGNILQNAVKAAGATAPSWWSSAPTAASIAALILATPANLLATDSSGRVLLQPTQTGVTIPTVTTLTNAVVLPSSASINITGNITGNLSGTVGSVTGAVGSVTGNVGGVSGVTFNGSVPSLAQIEAGTIAGVATVGTVTNPVTLGANEDTALTRLFAMTNSTPVFTIAALANGPSGTGSTPAAIATYMFTELFSNSDFSTTGSFGAWAKANIAQTGDSFARLGAPSGGSIDADIIANTTALMELQGVVGKNNGMRNTVYTSGNLTSYDLCLYDTSGHATTNDGSTGLLHKYSVVNSYDGSGNLLTSVTTRVS